MKYSGFLFILFLAAFSQAAQNPAPKKPAAIAPETAAQAKEKAEAEAKAALVLSKLADLIQNQYNKTTSATFSFEQSYKHPFMAVNESSKGKVFFKAQNMLWRYEEPADRQKEFYIAGKKFTYYLKNDRLAYTHGCFDQDTLSASITFLWGRGKLKESFTIAPVLGKTPNESLKWLKLVPKEKNAPVKSILLGADAKGVVKESLVVDQSDGANHFKFSDFVMNQAIPDKTFIFIPTEGVRVQPMPNVQCPNDTPTPKATVVPTPTKAPAPTPAPKATTKPIPSKPQAKGIQAE